MYNVPTQQPLVSIEGILENYKPTDWHLADAMVFVEPMHRTLVCF